MESEYIMPDTLTSEILTLPLPVCVSVPTEILAASV